MTDMISGWFGGSTKAGKASKAARLQQEKSLAAQEAGQARAQVSEDKRATDLSGQLAAQRRAVAARSGGRSSLAYAGPVTKLKTTLGG